MKIWIVEQGSGSYDDYRSWPIKAFYTLDEAYAWVEIHNPAHMAKMAAEEAEAQEYKRRFDVLIKEGSQAERNIAFELLEEEWKGKISEWGVDDHGFSVMLNPIELLP